MDIESDEEYQKEQKKIDLAHEDVQEFIRKMSYQYTPMMIAACMMVHSMRLYKTHLSNLEYEMIMNKIFGERHRIQRND